MRTLFLHPPSFDGFDGGAGARYQMKREVRSFWYPTWLAQPAALVEGSKLIDAPPHRLKFEDIAPELSGRELVVMHTSTPSFKSDLKTAEMIKAVNPDIRIGFIGAKVAVEPEKSLIAAPAVDFVARNEFAAWTSPSRKSPTAGPGMTSRGFRTATARASSFTTRTAKFLRTWTRSPG